MGWPARVRVWEPAAPPTEKAPALAPPLMAQVTGVAVPPGRASVRLTPVAAPAPWLETVTVWPMGLPEDTGVASAVLVPATSGHCTTMGTGPTASEPSL